MTKKKNKEKDRCPACGSELESADQAVLPDDHAEIMCDLGIMLPEYTINSINHDALLLVKRDKLGDEKLNKEIKEFTDAFLDVKWEK